MPLDMNDSHGVPRQNKFCCLESQKNLEILNRWRVLPSFPNDTWWAERESHVENIRFEKQWIESERTSIREIIKEVPLDPDGFMNWFVGLEKKGPGQNTPLFQWLAEEASLEEMIWFLRQEVAGEAGFEDLTALTQVRFPTRPKLEMARNFWDEMGRGKEQGMHGPMLSRLAEELGITVEGPEDIVPEALALGNLMMAFASHRCYAYQSVGALGVIELTAPGRAKQVHQGLKRLGISKEGQTYYALHAVVDLKHSKDWNEEVLSPLVHENPECIPYLAEGAWLRLLSGERCFKRYLRELGRESLANF